MRTEAYTVGFDTANYHAPVPQGYSQEEITKRREGNISENILRYLGEYRLGAKYDEFFYSIKTSDVGETYLESPHADPGPIINVYRKAIDYRQERGLSVKREVAECLGFQKLQDELAYAPVGTMALWVSPPGSKEDGYGTHSFTFIAQVLEDPEEGKSLRIIPYRNELGIEEHKEYLKYFDKNVQNYDKDTDFLANPTIIRQSDTIQTSDDIITLIGETEKFNIEWRDKLIPLVMPLVGGFIQLVRENASDQELIKARYAIENRVLEEKDYIFGKEKAPKIVFEKTPQVIFERYGNITPPVVGGSCGFSASGESSSIFSTQPEDKYGKRTFACPDCGMTNLRPENELLSSCQHCGSDNVSCCDTSEKKSSPALTA